MSTYFKIETDVAQNLIDDFFLTLTVRGPFHWKDFKCKKHGRTGLISEKTEALYAELNKRPEAATSSYSTIGDFLQNFYSVLLTKNHQEIQFRCLVHEFSFADVITDINHTYSEAILKENPLWLLPFCMAVATSRYYEKVCRTMRTATVLNLNSCTSRLCK